MTETNKRSRSRSPRRDTELAIRPQMPEPDSLVLKDHLQSLHEITAASSDENDSRIYVDNLPKEVDSDDFLDIFINSMKVLNLVIREGDPIVKYSRPKKSTFIFIDFRSVEEANNALILGGMTYEGNQLKVSRPKYYTGSQPINSSAMTSLFGTYASKNTPKMALEELSAKLFCHTKKIDPPSTVLNLQKIVSPSELQNEMEYQDLIEDIKEECQKHGYLVSIKLPRPKEVGMGNAYVQYTTVEEAIKARSVLCTLKFNGKFVNARFHPEVMFECSDFRDPELMFK